MRYDDLVKLLGEYRWFDLAAIVQLSGEIPASLRVQLSRWCKAGRLLRLRRGMYAFPEAYGRGTVNPAELANGLYVPSYLSLHWALGYYGMIPERVTVFTGVSTRAPRTFKNAFGTFRYRSVKVSAFFGFRTLEMDGAPVLIAAPEKALLDLWHLEKGEWGRERMEAMRFQAFDMVGPARLAKYAAGFESARLRRAVTSWEAMRRERADREVEP